MILFYEESAFSLFGVFDWSSEIIFVVLENFGLLLVAFDEEAGESGSIGIYVEGVEIIIFIVDLCWAGVTIFFLFLKSFKVRVRKGFLLLFVLNIFFFHRMRF